MPKIRSNDFTESTRPGTVSRVFEQHKKNGLNANGEKPVFIVPEVIEKKNKTKYLVSE